MLRFDLLELGLVVGFMGLVALLEIWVWVWLKSGFGGFVICWRLNMGKNTKKNTKNMNMLF